MSEHNYFSKYITRLPRIARLFFKKIGFLHHAAEFPLALNSEPTYTCSTLHKTLNVRLKTDMIMHVTIFCLSILALTCLGTTIEYKPLELRLKAADHVLVGVATNLTVMDQAGKIETNLQARVTGGHTCRLTVLVDEVIKSNTNAVPPTFTVNYCNKWIRNVANEQEAFVGKKMIYLLRGNGFEPTDDFQFVESLENKDEIRKSLQRKQTAKAEPTNSTYSSSAADSKR